MGLKTVGGVGTRDAAVMHHRGQLPGLERNTRAVFVAQRNRVARKGGWEVWDVWAGRQCTSSTWRGQSQASGCMHVRAHAWQELPSSCVLTSDVWPGNSVGRLRRLRGRLSQMQRSSRRQLQALLKAGHL